MEAFGVYLSICGLTADEFSVSGWRLFSYANASAQVWAFLSGTRS